MYSRFLEGETPQNFEEFQVTANRNAFGKYDARTDILFKGTSMMQPMHLGHGVDTGDAEQIVEMQPHFDSKQWIILYYISGKNSCNDGKNTIPLGIGVTCDTREKAEELLTTLENNPVSIRPFFMEAGKEAQGSGVKAVLDESSSRAPKFNQMKNTFLIVRADAQNFNAQYIDGNGEEVSQSQKMQELLAQAKSKTESNRRAATQVAETVEKSKGDVLTKIMRMFGYSED